MRNIKLTEAEWRYICEVLGFYDNPKFYKEEIDLADSRQPKYPTKLWLRKNALLKRAQRKIYNAKREVA